MNRPPIIPGIPRLATRALVPKRCIICKREFVCPGSPNAQTCPPLNGQLKSECQRKNMREKVRRWQAKQAKRAKHSRNKKGSAT